MRDGGAQMYTGKCCSNNPNNTNNCTAGIQNGGMRDDGAQMYTGIDSRTLNKKTSNRGSFCSNSHQGSPRSSGDLNRRSSNGCVLLESCNHCT